MMHESPRDRGAWMMTADRKHHSESRNVQGDLLLPYRELVRDNKRGFVRVSTTGTTGAFGRSWDLPENSS